MLKYSGDAESVEWVNMAFRKVHPTAIMLL